MNLILVLLLGLFCLYMLAHVWIGKNRCFYCGQIVGHEPNCPWSIVG
jgi:hypothetical protein